MTDISRRGFLGGTAACAVAAALPVLVAPELSGVAINMAYRASMPPIFDGAVGTYNGVLVREVWAIDLGAAARQSLVRWYQKRGSDAFEEWAPWE